MSKQQRTRLALVLSVGTLAVVIAFSIHLAWAQFESSDSYEIDSDGDGLPDAVEEAWSTDPNDPDKFVDLERELIVALDGEQRGELPSGDLPQPEQVSVAAWVQLRTNATGRIVSQGAYSLGVEAGHLTFQVHIDGQAWPLRAPISVPIDGEEHWVAGSFDGRALRLYLDSAVPIAVAHISGTVDASEEALVVGEVSGTVANVRVYGRALSDAEVFLVGALAGTEAATEEQR